MKRCIDELTRRLTAVADWFCRLSPADPDDYDLDDSLSSCTCSHPGWSRLGYPGIGLVDHCQWCLGKVDPSRARLDDGLNRLEGLKRADARAANRTFNRKASS